MQTVRKLLLASGLVIMTSPLCFTAQAQDYVDVEAERAANATGTAPASSYGASPATSYGMDNAPAAATARTAAPGAAPAGASGGQNVSALFLQLQQLQQEVMRLNGKVEEQAHELRQLKQQSLERYMDLDKRMSSGVAAAPVAGAAAIAATSDAPSTASAPLTTGPGSAAEQPGEAAAYNAAYALVRNQQFDQAVAAFQKFQRDFPAGKYAPNAYYWLGELYLVVQPQDLESSRQAFTMLLNQYPDNSKAPDALYKLGKVQCMKGDKDRAREYLEQVISKYGSTNSSAVRLAREFNYETC